MDRESTTGENLLCSPCPQTSLAQAHVAQTKLRHMAKCVGGWFVELEITRRFFSLGRNRGFSLGVKIKLRHSHLLIRRGSETVAMALAEYS